MALVKCHECGREVSTEAAACPNCGAKPRQSVGQMPRQPVHLRAEHKVLLVLIAVVAAF